MAPYLARAELSRPYLRAAWTLLEHASHLVVDLRDGHGGAPDSVALFCSPLLGPEPVHLQSVESRTAPTEEFWNSPDRVRLDDVPVWVLTSSTTFSGCEKIAYDLQAAGRRPRAAGRARVVGETTAGAAHPVDLFRIGPELVVRLPIARSVNAVTGSNWEGRGVEPDLACPADRALERALAEAAREGSS